PPDEFTKLYALPDGEVLKRVAPPYPEARMAYYKKEHASQAQQIPDGPITMYFRYGGGKLTNWGMTFSTSEDGERLQGLLRGLADIYPQEVEGDDGLLKELIKGDFIVREGAAKEKVVARLAAILRQECKLPVKLTFREVERKVIVASGRYQAKPLPGRKEGEVDIYGKQLAENSGAGGGSGDCNEFLAGVGMFIDRRVVGEVEAPPKGKLEWRYHRRSPFTEQEQREDTDPEAVCKHLSEQTFTEYT